MNAHKAVVSFVGGLLMAFVCFSFLSAPFEEVGALITFIFVSGGILIANILTPPSHILWISSFITVIVFSFIRAANTISAVALALACGVLLSVSCNAIIPDDKATLTALFALPGFVMGVLAITFL